MKGKNGKPIKVKPGMYATAHPYPHSDGFLRWEPVVQNVRHAINNCFMNLILGKDACKFQDTQKQAVEIALFESLNLI